MERSEARDVLTLMRRSPEIPDAALYGAERQLVIEFSDITEPMPGHILASHEHMQQILDFGRSWNRKAPLLVHCFAGISRSTAAAYAIACDLVPHMDETVLARTLRQLSPGATPNIHLIRLADDLLDRQGRMVDAITAIGRGADAFEGNPFSLDIFPA
jgi:Predicted protein tyrosine phosphatase